MAVATVNGIFPYSLPPLRCDAKERERERADHVIFHGILNLQQRATISLATHFHRSRLMFHASEIYFVYMCIISQVESLRRGQIETQTETCI